MAAHWEAGGSQDLRAREPISERKMGSWRQAALQNQQETSRVVFGDVIVLFSASRQELTIPCQACGTVYLLETNSPLARNPAILCPIPSQVTFTKSDSLQRRPSPCPTRPEMSLLSWSPELRPPLAIWLRQSEHTVSPAWTPQPGLSSPPFRQLPPFPR